MRIAPARAFVFGILLTTFASLVRAEAPDDARVKQIASWMEPGTYSPTPNVENRDFWKKVGQSQLYHSIVKTAEAEAGKPFQKLPDELYLEYSQNGNRSRYQNVYFRKLKRFRALVIAECVENEGRFIQPIQGAISSYATDKTWVLPAHDSELENFSGRQITIDLFASEVACDFATTDYLLGDCLADKARTRIREEVSRRVFEPYTTMVLHGKPRMWWLTGTNNWNAVCLANVTSAALALLESPAEKAIYVASAEKYIHSFLKGFTDDGYCSEGIGYWNYGFGCFVRLGHMLHGATGGRVDLFASPKVRNAGLFARRMEIVPRWFPAFADCTVGSRPSPGIMAYVTRRFDLPPTAWEQSGYATARWLDELGVFSFVVDEDGADARETAEPAMRDWFEKAGILICRGATTERGLPFAVALKGGHNAEHHNHNDIGSYVVCLGDAMPLTDPGAEVYTRRTFSRDRYVSGVLNSFGHPVPRVAGQLQKTGRSAAARVLALDTAKETDTLKLELATAYPVESLERLERTFVYRRGPRPSLTVTDEVEFTSPQSFGTALITFDSWKKIGDSRLRIGDGEQAVVVEIDAGGVPFDIEQTEIDEDVLGGKKPTRLGIDLTEPVREATVCLSIRPAEADSAAGAR